MNRCEHSTDGRFQIVSVGGEVDLSWSSQIRRAVLDSLRNGDYTLVDLSAVTYIDSSGIAALVEGLQSAKRDEKGFALTSVSEPVMAVLCLARLDQVFPIYGSAAEIDAAAQD